VHIVGKVAIAVALSIGGAVATVAQPALAHGADTPVEIVRRGSSGFRVLQVQYVLRSLGYQIAADGRFGPATERAVKAFQASRGLVADGIVGPKTAAALGLTAPAAAPAPSPAPAPAPTGDVYTHPRASVERWHAAALEAGWTESEWQKLSCIINRESGGVPTARNRSSGAAGLLQIMWSAHKSWMGVTQEQLLDGPTNLRIGRQLFLRSGWSPWKSVTNAC
jgi:hypothetical protein